jgi:3-phenylpropionate/trans-cinnamate dioxygenase ferredoxin subunit
VRSDGAVLVRVCRLEELPPGSARRIEVGGVPVAVFNVEGTCYAIGDTCSHEEASLSEGYVDDTTVECPKHGAMFDLSTGGNKSLPATRPVPSYRTVVDQGDLYVETSE